MSFQSLCHKSNAMLFESDFNDRVKCYSTSAIIGVTRRNEVFIVSIPNGLLVAEKEMPENDREIFRVSSDLKTVKSLIF